MAVSTRRIGKTMTTHDTTPESASDRAILRAGGVLEARPRPGYRYIMRHAGYTQRVDVIAHRGGLLYLTDSGYWHPLCDAPGAQWERLDSFDLDSPRKPFTVEGA